MTQAAPKRPFVDEIVDYYNPETNSLIHKGTPVKVIEKRVNSKGYHDLINFMLSESKSIARGTRGDRQEGCRIWHEGAEFLQNRFGSTW